MARRVLLPALLPAGLAFGVVAEWAAFEQDRAALAAADFAVGAVLIASGVAAWLRRPASRVGAIMTLAGYAWYLGTALAPALFLHRGVLVHLHLSYPTGRLSTKLARGVVAMSYAVAAVEPLARRDWLTLALSAVVALAAVQVFLRTSGPARKAGGPALTAALAFAGVLALGAVARLGGADADDAVLWAYDAVIAAAALWLLYDLLRGRWAESVVTGLVVELGGLEGAAPLREKLAHALADSSLVVAYRLPETGAYVDDAGRPVELPGQGSRRVATPIDDRGERIAVLVHDEGVLADRRLLESVAAAARLAVANARLQAEALVRADELQASRRRLVEAADAQRRRLEQELRQGAERRLETVTALLADARAEAPDDGAALAALEAELAEARDELRELAHGIHPAALGEEGLVPALGRLAARVPLRVEVDGAVGRLPAPVEAALFFVCSEALANTTKHAAASRASIRVRQEDDRVVVEITDDGEGGADPVSGTGLRGLADRVEALGGRLAVVSPPGAGTSVVADVPLG